MSKEPTRHDATLRTIPVDQNTEQSTQNSERVARRLAQHKAAITAKPLDVHIRVKVPRVKLPPADDVVKHKIRMHVMCTILGAILVGMCDLVFGSMFVLHFGTFIQTGPNLGMYYTDRVRNR